MFRYVLLHYFLINGVKVINDIVMLIIIIVNIVTVTVIVVELHGHAGVRTVN